MKVKFLFFIILLLSINAYSQDNFKQILDKINWQGTESDIVCSLYNYIEKSEHEEWDFENTESNYRFKNVVLANTKICHSLVRVNQDTKKLYRLQFVFLCSETDLELYTKIENSLKKYFGEPTEHIYSKRKSVWIFDKYKMETDLFDHYASTNEIESYSFSVDFEPIKTFNVNWENAIVESNNSRSVIPKIEYFRIDNENNVYIKEKNKMTIKNDCEKIIPTHKGEVVVFDGGMFCYRKNENDIVYIKNGFAVSYPIVR